MYEILNRIKKHLKNFQKTFFFASFWSKSRNGGDSQIWCKKWIRNSRDHELWNHEIRESPVSANIKIIFGLFPTHSVKNFRRLQGSWRKQRWPASSHTNFSMETNKVCKDASPPYELAQWVEKLFKGAFTFSCIQRF